MSNTLSRKLDKERLIRKLLGLDTEFYQKVKLKADQLSLSVPKFIFQALFDYLIKLEEEDKAEQNIKIVQFKSISSNEVQKEQVQDSRSSNDLSSSGVVDIEGHLIEKAAEKLITAWVTSEEEQSENEYLRMLGEKFAKENITR